MKLTRSGFLTGLIVVLALWVGSLISSVMPDPDEVYAQPFVREVVLEQPAQLRTGTVTATAIRSASEVELQGTVAATSGVWLVIDVTFDPIGETSALATAGIMLETASGARYGGRQVVNACAASVQPGLPMACSIAIEVPTDADLVGAHLLIPAQTTVDAMDDLADIDLELTPERSTALLGATGRIELVNSEVGG